MSQGAPPSPPWLAFVQAFVQACELGERLPEAEVLPPAAWDGPTDSGPQVVLCSPHPDDEILTGALPLRLRRELGARVVNLALTLGSDPERQLARWEELRAACSVVGFQCQRLATLPGFSLKDGPSGYGWPEAVATLTGLFETLAPTLVVLPHAEDHHPAHVMAHALVTSALTRLPGPVLSLQTEYWRPMAAPNLLVGISPDDLARLLSALACHRGEIRRNPYHLSLPARLLDNVRRGAELVASVSGGRPAFLFGELYRLCRWHGGRPEPIVSRPGWLGPEDSLAGLLRYLVTPNLC